MLVLNNPFMLEVIGNLNANSKNVPKIELPMRAIKLKPLHLTV